MTTTKLILKPGDAGIATCKLWRRAGSFGFLRVPGVEADLFCPRRSLNRQPALNEGDRVSFVVALDKSGRIMASDVTLLDARGGKG